jgi:hypothetical protein
MEGIFFILIFIGVIAITAVLFGVWVFVAVVRVITRMVGAVLAPPRMPPMPNVRRISQIRCSNGRCHAVNPSGARFCRRCGQALGAHRVSTPQAAMW